MVKKGWIDHSNLRSLYLLSRIGQSNSLTILRIIKVCETFLLRIKCRWRIATTQMFFFLGKHHKKCSSSPYRGIWGYIFLQSYFGI